MEETEMKNKDIPENGFSLVFTSRYYVPSYVFLEFITEGTFQHKTQSNNPQSMR
jgi:hypothetical protein